MEGYAVRIALSFYHLEHVLEKWYDMCDQVVVYEHPSPPASRVHCHLLIVNPTFSSKTFKDRSGLASGGNTFWSWKNLKPATKESAEQYIRYMTKGLYDSSYSKGRNAVFSYEDFAKQKSLWITYNPVKLAHISQSHKQYLSWLEVWEKDIYSSLVFRALTDPDAKSSHDVYIKFLSDHVVKWLIEQNGGFYNQQVANQRINFMRSYYFKIKYTP